MGARKAREPFFVKECMIPSDSAGKRSEMHISVTVSLQGAVLIVGLLLVFLLVRIVGKSRRYRTSRVGKASRKGSLPTRRPSWKRDHGARIAWRHGRERSPDWPRVAKEHLLREPACVACGYQGQGIQVHHIKPFHLSPDLELDPQNLITLCEAKGREHHFLLGHLADWESYNPNVRHDVRRFRNENARQIRAEPAWQEKVQRRPLS